MAARDRTLTRSEWDERKEAVDAQLFRDYPTSELSWRFHTAHKVMIREYGPRPPGRIGLLIKALIAYLKAGDKAMDFSWTKNAWKGIRGLLLSGVGIFILGFLGALDTTGELEAIGVPKWVAPIVVLIVGAAIPMVRNYFKIKKGVGGI